MQPESRKGMKCFGAALIVAFALLFAVPAAAMDPSLLSCDAKGKAYHTASVIFEISSSEVLPQGYGAHFLYYEDGEKHEGKNREALSIYEGCSAAIIPEHVPGYYISVEFPDKNVKVWNAGTQKNESLASHNGRIYLYDENELYEGCHFVMPAEDITVKIVYWKASEQIQLRIDNAYGDIIPVNGTCKMPSAPTTGKGTFLGWRINGDQLVQPGETRKLSDGWIYSEWGPKIEKPDYLDVSFYRDVHGNMARFKVNTKHPDMQGKLIFTPSVRYKEGEKYYMPAYGTVTVDGYLCEVYGDTMDVVAPPFDNPGVKTFIDLSSGSYDFGSTGMNASSAANTLNYFFAGNTYKVSNLYYDHSVTGDGALYYRAMDLNGDGHYDLREVGDVTTRNSTSPDTGYPNQIVAMKGIDHCEHGTYTFESGMAQFGTVTIKLFDTYKVRFMDGDSLLQEKETRADKPMKEPESPVKEGYDLKGWKITEGNVAGSKTGDLYDFAKPVTGDLTLTAVWEKKQSADPGKEGSTVTGEPVVTVFSEGEGKPVYTVTSRGDDKNPPTVSYDLPKKSQGRSKTVKIPATVEYKGVTYRVTAFAKGAIASEKKITTLDLGEYLSVLPGKSLKGCKKLKVIKIRNKNKVIKLTKKSFSGIKGKITLKVPANLVKAYKKRIKKLKLTKKVAVKKL